MASWFKIEAAELAGGVYGPVAVRNGGAQFGHFSSKPYKN